MGPGVSVFVQEKLEGRLYYFDHVARGGSTDAELFAHVENIVRLAHEAELYDVDLHAGNLMVVEGPDGSRMPKLFDFNFIPFYIHPPNPLVGLLLKVGWLDLRSRDLRKLRNFHDFRRFEKKINRFDNTDTRASV